MEPERGREVVNAVWQEYRDWALTSRGQKKTFESARKWAIRFAITGAILATLSGQFERGRRFELGNPNPSRGGPDGEVPTVSGHVPVQLVLGFAEGDPALGLVFDGVPVDPGIQHNVGVSNADPHASAPEGSSDAF